MLNIPLGQKTDYISEYQPDLLFPIARQINRTPIQVTTALPFQGYDLWNAFELSWLNTKGKPVVALGEFIFPCESPFLIESKSFKLYLNSFNNSKFESFDHVMQVMQKDLSKAAGANVNVRIFSLANAICDIANTFESQSLDDIDIACDEFIVNPMLLKTENSHVTERLHSDLLKSNCLVTNQPDWGSVCIQYTGQKILHESLLRYIVSFRNHNEFHEQCVERIFMDIMQYCKPTQLTVEARYTRRGGLDINPYRSTDKSFSKNQRLCRQ